MSNSNFSSRHNGPRNHEVEQMLQKIGVKSIDELIDKTVPSAIRLPKALHLPEPLSEYEYLKELKTISLKNKVFEHT